MAKVDHSTSFYQKMGELQDKLKRSEEERMKLEEKFTLMMKSCREEEEKRIRALRERYEKFLDDDKRRRDRNERILHTLEKIESRASSLSAKSERLKLLRRHYEAYLVRMYPLWKKQSISATQPSIPTNYPLSLPMETEKGLPWFGGGSGLYMNMPLLSARSSLSPGSDQLWIPPVLPRNIPVYDNAKQTTVHKQVERKNSVVETNNPAVEGALDNYLQRAAELLRVPVEEIEGHSEKRDEEKSVHTEQDTSRDLLNVSLSDDSILFEKKAEKTRGNATIVGTKETMEKMVEEEKVPEIDYLAGGDNMLSELQPARFHQQDILKQSEFAKGTANAQEENMYNSNNIESDSGNVNKNISDIGSIPSEQELFANGAYQNSDLQGGYEEGLKGKGDEGVNNSDMNNSHIISDKNLEYINVDNTDIQEPFASVAQQEYVDNASRYDASYESVQHPPTQQQSSDIQLNLTNIANESPENEEHLNFASEQEATNEEQECIENIGENGNYFPQQHANIIPQEFTEHQEDTAQITIADGQEQTTVAIDKSQLENDNHKGEYTELQYNNQTYSPENTNDTNQYDQGQYDENSGLQYEQYPNETQQYEQEQYIGDEQQLYNQQYPEQFSNVENPEQLEEALADNERLVGEYPEQYTSEENPEQLEEAYIDNERQVGQYEANNVQYEEQLIDPNQQAGNNSQNDEGENINEEQVENQIYNTNSGRESQELVASLQPALNKNMEDGDLMSQAEKEPGDDETVQKDNVDNQEFTSQQSKMEQDDSDQILENQEQETRDVIKPETVERLEEEGNGGVSEVQEQQSFDVNAPGEAVMKSNDPSAIEEDSEESSTGFWNPPHHSSIPSVDELAPKAAVITEDTSESSADSKMDPPLGKQSVPKTIQQFRTLLGVPSDPAGDSALSDQDEVEDQLAALMEDPSTKVPAVVETKHNPKTKVKLTESSQKVKQEKSVNIEPSKSKPQKNSKTNKTSDSTKPSTRTGLKKPPSLIKVLESDTESLNLDTGAASNVDSDEFDFSTE